MKNNKNLTNSNSTRVIELINTVALVTTSRKNENMEVKNEVKEYSLSESIEPVNENNEINSFINKPWNL